MGEVAAKRPEWVETPLLQNCLARLFFADGASTHSVARYARATSPTEGEEEGWRDDSLFRVKNKESSENRQTWRDGGVVKPVTTTNHPKLRR